MLANRLRKRQRHLRKWAARQNTTCYRLYERDIPEYPLIVDWYDGEAVVWLYERKRDETPEEEDAFRDEALAEIQAGLNLSVAQIFVKERARQRGSEQYGRFDQQSHLRTVSEQGLRFEVNLSDYLDTGLFLDHRITRNMVRQRARDKRMLNLFAYTGSFTCYALDGGTAVTTTVDLSNTYCDWTARNMTLNGFTPNQQNRIIQADCLQYLDDAAQRRERYDLIVCDPPTFSNSKRMAQGSFDVNRDHPDLIRACACLLSPGGELFFSNNSRRFKLDEAALSGLAVQDITAQTIPADFRNQRIHQCWLIQQ
ncbi:MAG: class I SAM-dependent methyltransferase [Ardenticatenaceae bacterium]|nr:class I SAM-dependent methyltransferase [Anaerolineales bacterium]MCB8923474.1 class I SAM-dependent methyltransferase [Ardenticatenaceae bacterium]MCB8991371.1 class I SAM-dependent methyltransferase [Ardenticatenaceae bacterium]MCB9003801.1 class I SAM-dependent methyltransferase [Ardenticatenaceae bacterium]